MEKRLTTVIPLIGANKEETLKYLEASERIGADSVLLMAPFDNICRSLIPVKKSEALEDILPPVPAQQLCDTPSLMLVSHWADLFSELAPRYRAKGIEPYYWFCHSIGHGGELSGSETAVFQKLTGLEGEEAPGCYCPLDERFSEYLLEAFRIIARTGTELILIDDDFRLNYHIPGAALGCYCPLHIARFNKMHNLSLSREEIARGVIEGNDGIRSKWVQSAGSSLIEFAYRIEKAVHAVSPKTRIGLATAMTHWSSEGLDITDLAKTLAGGTKPYVRLFGAPYHAKEVMHAMGYTFESVRFQKNHLERAGVEVWGEGDTYPHTRFFTSKTIYKTYMQGMRASGMERMLHYSFPFSATSSFEPSYLQAAEELIPCLKAADEWFTGNWTSRGICPVISYNNFVNVRLTSDMTPREQSWPGEPVVLKALSRFGIPTAFVDDHTPDPVLLTGDNGADMSDNEIEKLLERGVILDATAACRLMKRGFDIGLEAVEKSGFNAAFELYADPAFSPHYQDEQIWLLPPSQVEFAKLIPKKEAKSISYFCDGSSDRKSPAVITYMDQKGRKLMILGFDFYVMRNSFQVINNYARAEQIKQVLNWMSGGKTPYILETPDKYCLAYQSQNGNERMFFLQNLGHDTWENPVIYVGDGIPDTDSVIYFNEKSIIVKPLPGARIETQNSQTLLKIPEKIRCGEFLMLRYKCN